MDVAYIIGLVFMGGLGLFVLFMVADGLGLPTLHAVGTVVDREYREFEKGYRTTIINNTPRAVPHVTPEQFLLRIDIDGRHAVGSVSKALFDAVKSNDAVRVAFQKRRLTGLLRIVDVKPT
ncbi:MAG: hypothetical protein WCL32_10390 [Planctomycetota bacterium]